MGMQDTLRALADPTRREILNLLKHSRSVSYTHLDVYKRQVFVCVIWSFDDMGLGEQVILSDKESKGGYYE